MAGLLFGTVVSGLALGAVHATLALGIVLVYRRLGFITVAQGAHFALGGFGAWVLQVAGVGYWSSLVIVPAAISLLAAVFERLALRLRHDDGTEDRANRLAIVTWGAALAVPGLLVVQFGAGVVSYAVPSELAGVVEVSGFLAPTYRLWTIAAALAGCLALSLVSGRLAGSSTVYASSAGLAAWGGVLAAPMFAIYPAMGAATGAIALAVALIGGMESLGWTVTSALGIGIVSMAGQLILPLFQWPDLLPFIVMVIVLIHRQSHTYAPAPKISTASDPDPYRTGETDSAGLIFVIGVFATAPLLLSRFSLHVGQNGLLFAMGAAALTLLTIRFGLLTFGHSAFLAIGGYTTALLIRSLGSPDLALACGVLLTGIMGVVTGIIVFKHRSTWAPAITLALGQLVYHASFSQAVGGATGLPLGLSRIPGTANVGDAATFYYVVLAAFALSILVIRRVARSRRGRGYMPETPLSGTWAVSAAVTGLAGGLMVLGWQFVDPGVFGESVSAQLVLIALIGGLHSIPLAIAAAFAVVIAERYVSLLSDNWTVLVGLSLTVAPHVRLFHPRGRPT